ncbi:oxaloacetate decarboxylase subunit alpha [[Clostridium] aminophilum]|uniref:oxaloacetate decarboxylase subunit alpha n=1 Tax=[Clostridium] aminophilum TaxID=1526 RepID=UPI0026F25DF6|nr:oxaloacetate decarboxylase subunit alpha [[Clostridium] aminophilum]MDD6196792.1 oxaloacetate decarboxylase subunit alpha [[Clostridium] aminophilum]
MSEGFFSRLFGASDNGAQQANSVASPYTGAKKPVKVVETVLRDAHQSLIATRMTTEQMMPIIPKMDEIGYYAVECWGGATFDSCLRFLNEDPWNRLRKLRDGFKKTKLQMLFRGQNILGYNHYADDVVEYFVQKSVANGIDIIRIFDCLNDIRNLETAVRAAKKEKAEAQIALSYTLGSAYTLDYWKNIAKNIEAMGADSLCIKDMAGLLTPYKAQELVSALKESVKIPIDLHSHYTSGVAAMTYLKAIEAGCDRIDTAISPFSMGTSQPATEVMVETLKGTKYDTGLDIEKLSEIAEYFQPQREEDIQSGLLNTKVLGVNINTLRYQVPGGMLSNLVSQLKAMNQESKYEEVLKEIPRVRADFGEPPLVTPSSQIVGAQAVFNVMMGERYKMIPKESKKFLKGEFGKTVKPFNPEVQKKAIGNEEPITCRPADLIAPQLPEYEAKIAQWKRQDEDVLTYALFPQVAEEFFKKREAGQTT